MNHLKENNLTGNKLTHMTHTEDLLLESSAHCELAIRTLKDVFNSLKGNTASEKPVKITVKVDGSPSFLCATDYYGKCFVATKSYLTSAKNPHATTPEECELLWSDKPDLCHKMKLLLKYAPMLNIPKDEIWQGDFLFASKDLKKIVVNDEECITYHPNTLVYAIPVKDPLATKVVRSEIGVCWHTRYKGDSAENFRITFDATVDELRNVPAVFQIDVRIPSIAGSITFTEDETAAVYGLLKEIESLIQWITSQLNYVEFINYEEKGYKIKDLLNIYKNVVVRRGDEQGSVEDFIKWIKERIEKEALKKKLQATREKYYEVIRVLTEYISIPENQKLLLTIWNTQNKISLLKEIYINKLEKLTRIKSFVHLLDRGYVPSLGEGFVVSDIDGNVQKLVTRLGFSRHNFSSQTVKGWMTDARSKQQQMQESWDDFYEEMQNKLGLDKTSNFNYSKNLDQVAHTVKSTDPSKPRMKNFIDVLNYLNNVEDPSKFIDIKFAANSDEKKDLPNNLSSKKKIYKGHVEVSSTTPKIFGLYQDEDHENPIEFLLGFKDSLSAAKKTVGDEVFWAFCIINIANKLENKTTVENLKHISIEDLENFTEVTLLKYYDPDKLKLSSSDGDNFIRPNIENRRGYSEGSKIFTSNFLDVDSDSKYVAFRRNILINKEGYITNIPEKDSLHCLIEKIGKESTAGADGWNPCDICICKEDYIGNIQGVLKNYIQEINKVNSISQKKSILIKVNNYLQSLLNEKIFISVSLKKTSNPRVELLNSTNTDINQPKFEDFDLLGWDLPLAILPSDQDFLRLVYDRGLKIYCLKSNNSPDTNKIIFSYRSFDGSLRGTYLDGQEFKSSLSSAEALLGKMPKNILSSVLVKYTGDTAIYNTNRDSTESSNYDFSYKDYFEEALKKFSYVEQHGSHIKIMNKSHKVFSNDLYREYLPTSENFRRLFTQFEDRIKQENSAIGYRDSRHLLNIINYINLAYAITVASNSEDPTEIKKLLCQLYCGCGKINSEVLTVMKFAPYVKIF